jgi:hypothetical protein
MRRTHQRTSPYTAVHSDCGDGAHQRLSGSAEGAPTQFASFSIICARDHEHSRHKLADITTNKHNETLVKRSRTHRARRHLSTVAVLQRVRERRQRDESAARVGRL